jgi:hypothetical protein
LYTFGCDIYVPDYASPENIGRIRDILVKWLNRPGGGLDRTDSRLYAKTRNVGIIRLKFLLIFGSRR